jgi:hypothetical protein
MRKLSQFATQALGKPSSSLKATSLAMPRTVEVISTAMNFDRYW